MTRTGCNEFRDYGCLVHKSGVINFKIAWSRGGGKNTKNHARFYFASPPYLYWEMWQTLKNRQKSTLHFITKNTRIVFAKFWWRIRLSWRFVTTHLAQWICFETPSKRATHKKRFVNGKHHLKQCQRSLCRCAARGGTCLASYYDAGWDGCTNVGNAFGGCTNRGDSTLLCACDFGRLHVD